MRRKWLPCLFGLGRSDVLLCIAKSVIVALWHVLYSERHFSWNFLDAHETNSDFEDSISDSDWWTQIVLANVFHLSNYCKPNVFARIWDLNAICATLHAKITPLHALYCEINFSWPFLFSRTWASISTSIARARSRSVRTFQLEMFHQSFQKWFYMCLLLDFNMQHRSWSNFTHVVIWIVSLNVSDMFL